MKMEMRLMKSRVKEKYLDFLERKNKNLYIVDRRR